MPEFKLPTIKLPGFREMTTDDITQAISDVPRPNVKLADIADAAIAATQAAAKAAQEAAAAAQSAAQSAAERAPISPIRQQRSRRPLFIVGMVPTRRISSCTISPRWASLRWQTPTGSGRVSPR